MNLGLSERRGCKIVGISRNSYRYKCKLKEDEIALRKRLNELADLRKRYGYRRQHLMLLKEGWEINHKRTQRLWQDEGLQIPKKSRRRRRKGPKGEVLKRAQFPNHVWSYDFMEDATIHGKRLKILNVMDEFTREWIAVKVSGSIKGEDVRRVLEKLVAERGAPMHIRSDNGPEFISMVVCEWLSEVGIETIFINPGSPWENPFIESTNDKIRDEKLNCEIFYTLKEAQVIIELFRKEYNEERPHSSLGNLTPSEMAAKSKDLPVSASLQQPDLCSLTR